MVRGSWPAEFHFRQSAISEGITERPSPSASPILAADQQQSPAAGHDLRSELADVAVDLDQR